MDSKNSFITKIKNSSAKVNFLYNNGIKNYVNCTLDFSNIPIQHQNKIGPNIEEIIVVWDIDNLRWIAFKWEKVVSIEY